MELVCLSDTHGAHEDVGVPEGDVLIHAGDFCQEGRLEEVEPFLDWFGNQPCDEKILVAGNHDGAFEDENIRGTARAWASEVATYLEDKSTTIGGRLFYGSPWILKDDDWAFMKPEQQLVRIWENIPTETDVLITHGPPRGMMDLFERKVESAGDQGQFRSERIGSVSLRDAIERVQPAVHVFGHNHFDYGTVRTNETMFINASLPKGRKGITHEPVVVEI